MTANAYQALTVLASDILTACSLPPMTVLRDHHYQVTAKGLEMGTSFIVKPCH